MVQDFSLELDGGMLMGRKKAADIPTTRVDGVIKDMQFRFTPTLYNHYMNIMGSLDLSEEDEAWSELVRDKATVIKAMRMIGVVRKRGEGLKNYWYKYYCCLSGGYLYFYEGNKQLYPTSYFYVKNAEVSDGLVEIGIENSLALRTKSDQCFLAFNNREDWKNWKHEIENAVQEISFLSEALYRKSQEPLDYADVVVAGRMRVDRMGFQFLDDNGVELMHCELGGIECLGVKRRGDITYDSKIRSMEMFHPSNAHYKRIIYSEGNGDFMNLHIEMLFKGSPRSREWARRDKRFPEAPQDEQKIYQFQVGSLVVHFPPKLIKRLTQILLDLKPKRVNKPPVPSLARPDRIGGRRKEGRSAEAAYVL